MKGGLETKKGGSRVNSRWAISLLLPTVSVIMVARVSPQGPWKIGFHFFRGYEFMHLLGNVWNWGIGVFRMENSNQMIHHPFPLLQKITLDSHIRIYSPKKKWLVSFWAALRNGLHIGKFNIVFLINLLKSTFISATIAVVANKVFFVYGKT